jgi:hypothetical protein
LPGTTLTLEEEHLPMVGSAQGDGPNNTFAGIRNEFLIPNS